METAAREKKKKTSIEALRNMYMVNASARIIDSWPSDNEILEYHIRETRGVNKRGRNVRGFQTKQSEPCRYITASSTASEKTFHFLGCRFYDSLPAARKGNARPRLRVKTAGVKISRKTLFFT